MRGNGLGVCESYVSMSQRQQQHRAVQQAVRHVSESSLLRSSTTYTVFFGASPYIGPGGGPPCQYCGCPG